jgi:hypothetical protein
VSTPTTSIDAGTGGVKITWTTPSNGGIAINAYLIEIANFDDTVWSTSTATCDGSDSTIISNLYCIIPMSTLTASPFSLTF